MAKLARVYLKNMSAHVIWVSLSFIMSDDPAGVCAVVCGTVCIELIGGFCLDFASTSKSPPVLVVRPFDPPLQPIRAPAVFAHGHLTPAQTTKSKM